MQMTSLGAAPWSLPAARPTASVPAPEGGIIADCFQSQEAPDFLGKALEGLKTLCKSSDPRLSRQGHVALAAVVAAGGGSLALSLCKAAYSLWQDDASLNPAAFACRLAGPLRGEEQNPVMFALTRAVAPHYGMAPGTQEVVDDLTLFMSPIHDGAEIQAGGRIGILKTRLEKLSQLPDDHSYAGYIHDAAQNGLSGAQIGERGGRTVVGGVMVRRRQ